MRNLAERYAREQEAIKRRNDLRQKQQAGAPAATGSGGGLSTPQGPGEQLDPPEVFQAKWLALRDRAMAELKEAMAAMLRQAVRFRGSIDFPVEAHAPVQQAAPAAAAGQQGA